MPTWNNIITLYINAKVTIVFGFVLFWLYVCQCLRGICFVLNKNEKWNLEIKLWFGSIYFNTQKCKKTFEQFLSMYLFCHNMKSLKSHVWISFPHTLTKKRQNKLNRMWNYDCVVYLCLFFVWPGPGPYSKTWK